jgi:hypothetical protein
MGPGYAARARLRQAAPRGGSEVARTAEIGFNVLVAAKVPVARKKKLEGQ